MVVVIEKLYLQQKKKFFSKVEFMVIIDLYENLHNLLMDILFLQDKEINLCKLLILTQVNSELLKKNSLKSLKKGKEI